jgi:hypothetical protein
MIKAAVPHVVRKLEKIQIIVLGVGIRVCLCEAHTIDGKSGLRKVSSTLQSIHLGDSCHGALGAIRSTMSC